MVSTLSPRAHVPGSLHAVQDAAPACDESRRCTDKQDFSDECGPPAIAFSEKSESSAQTLREADRPLPPPAIYRISGFSKLPWGRGEGDRRE